MIKNNIHRFRILSQAPFVLTGININEQNMELLYVTGEVCVKDLEYFDAK